MNQNIWFGKYEMIRPIAAGASSQVYLARHQFLHQLRAIKKVPKDTAYAQCARHEADILKSIHHPAIPVLFDVEEDNDAFYLIEEYITGESLEAYVLHQNLVSRTFLLNVGILLCDVIQYLHTCDTPVLYQDLKPEHIIVYGDQIKIVDFGIAAFLGQEHTFDSFGTKEYAPPEKILGQTCDETVDVYGIGCVLEFLWGYLPDSQKTKELHQVIEKAVRSNKNDRYRQADELGKALKEMNQEKHLQTAHRIAVLSSQPGIGATLVAVSCNVYLNSIGKRAFYMEENRSGHMAKLLESPHVRYDQKNKWIMHRDFFGTTWTGAGVQQILPKDCIQILDFGVYSEQNCELETCDLILVVLGSQLWQEEAAIQCAQKLKQYRSIRFLTTCGNQKAAKKYAAVLHEKLFCFPVDEDAFFVSREKQHFFEALFQKEGW